jgi:hypothetical protein
MSSAMNSAMNVAGTAALAGLVACAAAGPAAGAVVYFESNLSEPLPHARLVGMVNADVHRPSTGLWLGSLPAGSFSGQFADENAASFNAYCLVGVDSAGGVVVSFLNAGSVLGLEWTQVFPEMDESVAASAIISGGQAFDSFMKVLDTKPGVKAPISGAIECRTVHFSVANDFGSIVVDFAPVPAPGAALPLVAGAILAGRRRRAAGASG